MISESELVDAYRKEADEDYVGLWEIAASVEDEIGTQKQQEVRHHALNIARGLMSRGVYPGDYDYANKLSFWPGTADELVKRIEAEWIVLGKSPNPAEPICWFALRSVVSA